MNKVTLALVAVLLLIQVTTPQYGFAQIENTPEMQELIKAHGSKPFMSIIPDLAKGYATLLKNSPKQGVKLVSDISYGRDTKQMLDIYHPDYVGGAPRPVLVFIHGGGFVAGDKVANPEIYSNIGHYFARHGIVTVVATYRLAPKHKWPAGIEDMAGIVSWVNNNAGQYGGDPKRIFMMGQSAGGAHVASYVLNEKFHVNGGDDGVAGAILVSAALSQHDSDSYFAYYGKDQSKWEDRAILNKVAGRAIPLFVIDMEYDPYDIQASAVDLMSKVCSREKQCPWRMHIQGHNHISGIFHINTADDSYGREILQFIEQN